MLEVEVKYRVNDLSVIEGKLAGWRPQPRRYEVDHYFNAPDRDFARTDEALRVRTVNEKNFLTYKGPRRDPQTKTRFELELPLADGPHASAQWRELLSRLGYRPTGVVSKSRRPFTSNRHGFELAASLDEVNEVGTFVEIEVVTDETQFQGAKDLVLRMAQELGLNNPERRSYLELLLGKERTAFQFHVVSTVAELQREIATAKKRSVKVGFVPTMGALHAGHAALIDRARAECGYVVVSIFVNPTQFGPKEDFAKYPRTLHEDVDLCREHGVDLIFTPSVDTIYPRGFVNHVEVGQLATVFEGAIRPGHFRGVATIVLKLFNMVQADVAYFGQKDAQQVAVVRQLIRDFDVPVQLVVVPTVREADGLALSSRNRYLDATLRKEATVLSAALFAARQAVQNGERCSATIRQIMSTIVAQAPHVVLDYATVVDSETFREPQSLTGQALAIVAARFGDTRLIDNMEIGGDA